MANNTSNPDLKIAQIMQRRSVVSVIFRGQKMVTGLALSKDVKVIRMMHTSWFEICWLTRNSTKQYRIVVLRETKKRSSGITYLKVSISLKANLRALVVILG